MKKLKIKNKRITIYDDYDKEEPLDIIFYNTFKGDAKEVFEECKNLTKKEFIFVVIEDIDWDNEMTPYPNPPIFRGDSTYKGEASKHLKYLEDDVISKINKELICTPKEYIISGYSLGGLFSVYAYLESSLFTRFVSCSASLWYPNFIEYFKENFKQKHSKIYLSLGSKEKRCRDMSKCVEEKTLELYNFLQEQNIESIFELNHGNHFTDIPLRVAKGIKWILE